MTALHHPETCTSRRDLQLQLQVSATGAGLDDGNRHHETAQRTEESNA